MRKRMILIPLCFAILIVGFSAKSIHAQANEKISGTFVKSIYDEVVIDKNTTKRVLSKITIKNASGKTTTLAIDHYAKLSIDTVPVKIDAFKLGMKVEANVQLRRIKTLSGKTNTPPAVIAPDSKAYTGTVSYIARNANSLKLKLDNGQTKNIFYNAKTLFYKQTRKTDSSSLHEGDRVKVTFSAYNSTNITSLVIMEGGVQVAGLYKGTIHRIDPVSKKIILRNEMKYLNWEWYPNSVNSNSSYAYAQKTPIYLDNQPINPNDLRKYAGHKVYLATVNKFGKEQVERMIIQKDVERTYYEPLQSVNNKSKQIRLQDSGQFLYHSGTILIRNGRLVEPESLGAYGTALVVSAGPRTKQYANVIHISNDGFDAPLMKDHRLYFGEIQSVKGYEVSLTNTLQLSQNVWRLPTQNTFYFNNETISVQDRKTSYVTLPLDKYSSGKYGYFYIKDDEIIAAHLLPDGVSKLGQIVSVGRLASISNDRSTIDVRNVSQWQNGAWATQGYIRDMDIQQATFMKDEKVIKPEDLKINDRLYITGESTVKGKIIMVD